jgi:hypothetical protein
MKPYLTTTIDGTTLWLNLDRVRTIMPVDHPDHTAVSFSDKHIVIVKENFDSMIEMIFDMYEATPDET